MLLAPPPPVELPTEALLARLRARRAALELSSATTDEPTPAAVVDWLYPRLSRFLHTAIRPYLEVEAMRLLLLALRYRLGGAGVPAELLHRPWLAAELAPLLERPGDARLVVARVGQWLVPDYPFAARLAEGYLDQGPGRVEQQLGAGILQQALGTARAPAVRMTLRFLIDLRNILAVLRHWRWQLRTAPALLSGGELPPDSLLRAWAGADTAAVARLAARIGGSSVLNLEPRAAERLLLGGLTRRLRRAGRDPLGSAVVVDFLWRCRVAAGNRALHQSPLDPDGLAAAVLP